jgi:hypothetical protein
MYLKAKKALESRPIAIQFAPDYPDDCTLFYQNKEEWGLK